MATINGVLGTSTAELLKQKNKPEPSGASAFADHLKTALNEENQLQVEGDKALGDMATGQVKDLHQAAMAIEKAETSMKLMLEIRNKALSAYKELGRTQL
jgi:flagellar hook-basal body complex protein FliE